MALPPTEVLAADGELAPPDTWFPGSVELSSDPFVVVAITGPQASGKSTLVNALFSTSFPVATRGSIGTATTRGILASQLQTTRGAALVLDVEGADARARGRDAKIYASQCASFVTSIADVVIVNLWYHDACRLDSAAHSLLTSILFSAAKALVDGAPAKTALVIAVRDFDDDSQDASESVTTMIQEDVSILSNISHFFSPSANSLVSNSLRLVFCLCVHQVTDIWAEVVVESGLPVGDGATPLDHVIDLHVFMFPHIRHQAEKFDECVAAVRTAFDEGQLVLPEHSKRIPADGFSTYAHTIWDSIAATAADLSVSPADVFDRRVDDFYSGDDFAIVAAYRCDEVFSQKLAEASGDMADLLDTAEGGERIDSLGKKCDEIIERYLQEYDAETSDFATEPVYERKRTELEAIIDTGLMSVFMKNVAIISREVLMSFKTATSEDMPVDFALYTALTNFDKRAKEGIRRGGSWTFESERADLESMMREISDQKRKLLESQVSASQQQSKAIQFLRMQQAQMQAVQQQALGGSVGQWNVGAAYRPPDSNVNLSLAYQQGKTNLQVSMVPDESATLLGPTGFTAGVGPGNLGMSFNVNF
ncbi:P-loop containing nucleoside triphosphate hydrolase [Gracilaria domingensis]|nr:P-loop containing nucleoside triphosphate hydrolase [Gracilaria domingensis]